MLKIDDNVHFSLYHISKVFNYFAGTGRKELDDMNKVLRENESKYIENTTYPSFVINGNIAEAYTKMGENKNRIEKFFLMSQQEGEEDTAIIRMLKLMFLCSYVSYLKEVGDDYQAEEKRVIERSEQMISEDIPQRMRQMLNELLHSSDENKFKDFASKRQY